MGDSQQNCHENTLNEYKEGTYSLLMRTCENIFMITHKCSDPNIVLTHANAMYLKNLNICILRHYIVR